MTAFICRFTRFFVNDQVQYDKKGRKNFLIENVLVKKINEDIILFSVMSKCSV